MNYPKFTNLSNTLALSSSTYIIELINRQEDIDSERYKDTFKYIESYV